MNRFPWSSPDQHAYRGRCAIYSCRSSDEVGEHLIQLIRRAGALPDGHPWRVALNADIRALFEVAGMLTDLEEWAERRGACSCMDPECGALAEEAK